MRTPRTNRNVWSSFLMLAPLVLSQAQSLTDFGYLHFSSKFGPTSRQPPLGNRYCLVVMCDDKNNGTFVNSAQFYQGFIFDPTVSNSVNGYFKEMSCGRFQLAPAGVNGVMGPLTLTQSELNQLATSPGSATDGQVALSAAVRNGFPVATFDLNNDGNVTYDELVLLAIFNNPARGPGQTKLFSLNIGGKQCTLQLSAVPETTFLNRPATVTHELCHNVGNMYDLYYNTTYQGNGYVLNRGRTLAADLAQTHLDPWHKMAFGWNEPVIASLRRGGLFYLPAPQNGIPTAPLLLYDPSHGTAEYFLLEYRTTELPSGPGYDSQLGAQGLFIWHIQQDGNHDLLNTITSPFAFTGNTTPWTDWMEGPASIAVPLQPTPDASWPAGQFTPYLHWNDGSEGPAHVRVRSYSLTDNGIFVDVLVDKPDDITWVDFSYPGLPLFPELGTAIAPFNTLAKGLTGAAYGSTLDIRTGSTAETPTITTAITLQAIGGPVTIGF